MNPPVVAALAAAALAGGTMLIVAGLRGTDQPAGPPPAGAGRLAALLGVGLPARQRRRRTALAGTVCAATAAAWLVTGWPVGGFIAGAAVAGVPWLLGVGAAERRMIIQLEAVEAWTRRLKDLVHTGHGLISAIVASTRAVPPAIAEPVAGLAAELQAGADPQQALDRFADALADFTADEVVAALKLHVDDRGQRLSEVLTSVAAAAAREVAMRRTVSAKRAEPRFVTRFMTGLIAVVLAGLFINVSYARPYDTTTGQLVLAGASVLIAAILIWVRRLTQPVRRRRFLTAAGSREQAGRLTGQVAGP